MSNDNNNVAEGPRAVDPWFLAELFCWTMVALAPLMTWVNGPAVSADQFAVRTAVCVLALGGGLAIRVRAIVRRRDARRK